MRYADEITPEQIANAQSHTEALYRFLRVIEEWMGDHPDAYATDAPHDCLAAIKEKVHGLAKDIDGEPEGK